MLYTLCVLFVLVGCQAAISTVRPPLEEEGEIYLYIQASPSGSQQAQIYP